MAMAGVAQAAVAGMELLRCSAPTASMPIAVSRRGSPCLLMKSSSSKLFGSGSSAVLLTQSRRRQANVRSLCIRSEQTSEDAKSSVDIWLGRAAMVGFVSVLAVEIGTGKGLLENVGLPTPLPTVALAVTALIGAFTAFKVFQSGSKN